MIFINFVLISIHFQNAYIVLFTLQKKLPRMNPVSIWVELTLVDFCSVNADLPNYGGGLSLPEFKPGRYAFTLQKSTWANSTQVEPGFVLGRFSVV